MNEVNNNIHPDFNQNIGNQVPNQPMNYQNNNQPSNNNKSSNGLMVVIIILLLALIGVVVYAFILKPTDKKENNNTNNGTTNNEVQTHNNEIVEKETEVSNIDDYKYLINQLGGTVPCGSSLGVDISEYLNISAISDEFKFINAVSNLKEQKLSIKKTDQFYGTTYNEISSIEEDGSVYGYRASDIENEIKKIYGKNTVIDYKKAVQAPYAYDITAKIYFMAGGMGCGAPGSLFTVQYINRVTTLKNQLYVYAIVGSYTNEYVEKNDTFNEILYYDFKRDKNKFIYASSIDKKYTKKEKRDNEEIESINYVQYLKDNQDKFAKYKYTFEKEDNNYIIKKLEKIS